MLPRASLSLSNIQSDHTGGGGGQQREGDPCAGSIFGLTRRLGVPSACGVRRDGERLGGGKRVF